jgi:hypothetical protein
MTKLELMKVKDAAKELPDHFAMDWQTIASAPFDRDLEVAVFDTGETHAVVFPCRRVLRGWVSAETAAPVAIHPTHWREWQASNSALFVVLGPGIAQGGDL